MRVLMGSPVRESGVFVQLDPRAKFEKNVVYEYVYKLTEIQPIDWIIEQIMKLVMELKGLEVLSIWEDDEGYIHFQVRRKTALKLRTKVLNGVELARGFHFGIPLLLIVVLALVAIAAVFVFLLVGMYLAAAGVALVAAGIITFIIAGGAYKLLGVPMIVGGFYLFGKQFGLVT